MRKVGIGAGPGWVRDAMAMVLAHPAPFLVMGVILTCIPMIPLLGLLVMLLLGPALTGGMIYAAQRVDTQRDPEIGNLFRAFQEGDRIGSFMALCLPVVAAGFMLVIMAMPLVSAAVHSGAITKQTLEDPQAMQQALNGLLSSMPDKVLLFLAVTCMVLLLVGMVSFFASALVMLENKSAFTAMKLSFSACLRNFGAFIIAMLMLGFSVQILRYILSLVLPDFLAAALVNIPYYAVLGPLVYIAYCSIFETPDATRTPTENNPPAPPPAQHTFEA